MLVDSHCHLDFPDFAEDRAAVIERARAAGVATMVTISTKISRFDEIRAIAAENHGIWCSVGIHPHHVTEEPPVTAAEIAGRAADPLVVGIGETGLDYYYDNSPRAAQQESFRAHIAAAQQTGLPLIVHTRDADADTAKILREAHAAGPITGLLHCFSSSPELAETALELGFYISLSGIVTFKNAEGLRDIARTIPPDRLLVETDAPYLAPVPMRGKRNEPAFVAHTAAAVARLKDLPVEALASQTTANFYRLFARARPA